MEGKVVIIIPSQGEDIGAFESVARRLKREVYSKATIVKTTVEVYLTDHKETIGETTVTESGGSLSVTFATLDGHAFSWATTHGLSRVLTISHAFSRDGPNLAYGDGGYQPWGSDGATLAAAGQSFWQSVGRALRADGKIILLGCVMGAGAYAGNVATATGKQVYASTDLFAAGNAATALKYVRAIEKGRVPTPMKKFEP
jgi:hypothetical protein